MIEFLEFLTLGILEFAIKLIVHQVHFSFQFRFKFENFPMLVFYANHFKSLNKSKVTLLVTEISNKD